MCLYLQSLMAQPRVDWYLRQWSRSPSVIESSPLIGLNVGLGVRARARDGDVKDDTRVLVLEPAAVVPPLMLLLRSTALSFTADSTGTSADDCASERFLSRLALCALRALLSGATEGLAVLLLVNADAL